MEKLSAYIPMDRRLALAQDRSLPEQSHGAALFADISGFTPLTEMLALNYGPQRGAEELTGYLNLVYDALINDLHRHGGSVIGFSGDAITCWFDQDDGRRATAVALAMQQTMQQFANLQVTDEQSVSLSIKVAVASGPVRRFVVGDPLHTLVDALAGVTLERLADAEHQADKGDVILDEGTAIALEEHLTITEWRTDEEKGGRYAAVSSLNLDVPETNWEIPSDGDFEDDVLRAWLLPAVYQRLKQGQGEFLAELRPVVALFLRFGGIDYDGDANAAEKLDMFIMRVQQILAQYDGNLLQLSIGDKGSYLYASFGAPIAHEDDADRASLASIGLHALAEELDFIEPIQIGITHGRMRVGAYGGEARRTYGVLGDAVNLSARLMQAAEPGQTLVSEAAASRTGDRIAWEKLPAIKVKGKEERVELRRVVGLRKRGGSRLLEASYDLPMVGRQAELELISNKLDLSIEGKGQIVGITAEAGMGKSRLVSEVIGMAQSRPIDVYAGECQSYGRRSSYLVWRPVWRGLFGIQGDEPVEEQLEKVRKLLNEIDPSLVNRIPLLASLLNIDIPDNDLTQSLSAKLRKSSREALLADVVGALAKERPLLLILDDLHWLDPMSYDLITVTGRACANLPLMMLLVYRPLEGPDALKVSDFEHFTEVPLEGFTPEEGEQLIELKLRQVFGEEVAITADLLARIMERAAGNPFYIDELINYLRDHGIDVSDGEALESVELPASIHSLILSRMDQLDEGQKSVVKVASVIGRLFQTAVLLGAYPDLGEPEHVNESLSILSDLELTPLDTPDPELTYIFKHVITQEVAYESLLYRTRVLLHDQIGRYIERQFGDNLGQRVHLLAHHFERSENEEKKKEYLFKAGRLSQEEYSNASAIDYYQRLLPLLEGEEKIDVLRDLGHVLQLVGDWPEAEKRYKQAWELANELEDVSGRSWAETDLVELYRKQGNYEVAENWLGKAEENFQTINEREGLAKTLILGGTLAVQQGEFAIAQERYEQSLQIRREMNDLRNISNLLNNLGIMSRFQGALEAAKNYQEESLSIRREIDDRWGIANSLNNLGNVALDLGDIDLARTRLEEAVTIQKEIGEKWGIGNALNNLGNVVRSQGDVAAAKANYAESLEIYSVLRDKWALAYLFEDIGALSAQQGLGERALQLVGAASALREEIRAPLSEKEVNNLEQALEPVRNAMSPEAQEAAVQAGRSLSLTDSLLLAAEAVA